MPIIVACPSCGTRIKAPDVLIGKSAKCPKCWRELAVQIQPAQQQSNTYNLVAEQAESVASAFAQEHSPAKSGVPIEPCPRCHAELHVPPEVVGRWTQCPHCRMEFTASSIESGYGASELQASSPVAYRRAYEQPDESAKTLVPMVLIGAMVAALVMIALIVIVHSSGGSRPGYSERPSGDNRNFRVNGKYPEPTRRFQGRTAAQWGRMALDIDISICQDGCVGLGQLEAEGVPFLLVAANEHRERRLNLANCLAFLNGRFVDDADLDFVASFVHKQFAAIPPVHQLNKDIRIEAVWVLRAAGRRARRFIPLVQELRLEKENERFAEEAIKQIEQ